MVDALKKIDRKVLIIVGCIILIPVILIIFLTIMQGCGARKISYQGYEEKMISAAKKYFGDKLPKEEGEYITVTLNDLVEGKYIKSPEKLVGDSCSGEVTVRMNGASIEENNGGYLNYTVTLKCDNYSTIHLADKIKEDIVTSDSGLYLVNDEYVFKGDKVNNYISFYGKNYRIVSIDKNNIIKLFKANSENISRVWDNKYNSEINNSYGKTIYKDSEILNYIIEDYNNNKKISADAKKHIVAYDTCVGKRSVNDYRISKDVDCSEVLEKQVVSLLNISDFAMASNDPDCKDLSSKSCRNYNYLYNIMSSTWTPNAVSENSYQVYYLNSGATMYKNANSSSIYSLVIYIDGNELYTSGRGTETDPYVIK